MASSSGNSSGSTQLLQNSGSEEDLQNLMDQRKRKRKQSNRESARRSRMRKQQHLDDLTVQVAELRKEKNQILTSINITTQHYINVEAENSVLKAQMVELSQRLESLTDMLNYINTTNVGLFETPHHSVTTSNLIPTSAAHDHSFMNPWNHLLFQNQPIMATADTLQY